MSTLWPAWPQDYSFADAFGLSDDPFSPRTPPVKDKFLLADLHKRPLQVYRDVALIPLFVADAGPFSAHMTTFQRLLGIAGYWSNPKRATQSYAFLVSGEQGTGKSTLVYTLVDGLQHCGLTWTRVEYPPLNTAPERVPDLYDYLTAELDKTAGEPCYLVVDDLDEETALQALKFYENYSTTHVLIMFLITQNLELLHGVNANDRIDLQRFLTRPLKPDEAVTFVERRIEQFRIPSYSAKLARYPLFPFLAQDIRDAVAPKVGGFKEGPITLRVLGTTLHEALQKSLLSDGPRIILADMKPSQIHNHLILLGSAYADLVA